MPHRVLYVPKHPTPTAFALGVAARARGVEVVPVHRNEDLHAAGYVFGGPRFASHVAARLDLALIEPTDDWLAALPKKFTSRSIHVCRADQVGFLDAPAFVKQPREKVIDARVYPAGELQETSLLDASDLVLVSDPVRLASGVQAICP